MNGSLKKFDPSWVVELAEQQIPERAEVIEALKNCISGYWEGDAYFRFTEAQDPNMPGSKWQFKENIILKSATEGTLVLDWLETGEVGGIEFLSRIKGGK